jgi:hypothetical protein
MYNVVLGVPKVQKKWDEKSDFHAAKKDPKELVSSDCAKLLEKESSD